METSFLKLKRALLELKDGYPTHVFWGKIEFFQQPGVGKKAVELLVRHEVIEKITPKELDELLAHISPEDLAKMPPSREEKLESYRLTAKGVDLTISMINLEHSEETRKFTIAIIVLTILTFFIGLNQLILTYLQNPIF